MTDTAYVPRIRDLIKFDIIDTADWFLRVQFKQKDAKSRVETTPVHDADGNEIGLSTTLYPEFMSILFMAAGWKPLDDRDGYVICCTKDFGGYRASVGIVHRNHDPVVIIRRLEAE